MDDKQQDALFVRNFSLVLIGLALIGVIVFILAKMVYADFRKTQENAEAIGARIAPVGRANVSGDTITVAASTAEPSASTAAHAPAETHKPGAPEPVPLPAPTPAPTPEPETTTAAAETGGKGKEIYDSGCTICHATGVAGAPKLGDSATWNERLTQGVDVLYEHAINGFMGKAGLMPPKGGRSDFSDDDVKAAVDYMVSDSN